MTVGEQTQKRSYHHGNLAVSLLDAVDELATKFGLEAVTLRGCAKLVGVSPSSAFRHYSDKRALITAFAARAVNELSDQMVSTAARAVREDSDPFLAVGLAYIEFAIEKPAFFRAMWYREGIYSADPNYLEATNKLRGHLRSGFADTLRDDDACAFSPQELLAWSSVHGLAGLFVDGPIAQEHSQSEKIGMAAEMLKALKPAFKV